MVLSFGIILDEAQAVKMEKQIKSKYMDQGIRTQQTFDISKIPIGVKINQAIVSFPLTGYIGDTCYLILDEPYLKKDVISNPFTCDIINTVPLKLKGLHALESKLNKTDFNISVKTSNSWDKIGIKSNTLNIDLQYTEKTYYAKIENNKVVAVVISTPENIINFPGQYVETIRNDPLIKFAGKGDTYDPNNNKFTQTKPYPSWIANGDTWDPPISRPLDTAPYHWNESLQQWILSK